MDTFHVDPWNSRDNVEQRVQRRIRRNRVDRRIRRIRTQLSDAVEAGHATCDKTGSPQCQIERTRWRAKLEESWRPTTLALVVQDKKSQSLLAYVADLARDQHRRGGRVSLMFPWNWNVLTTLPIQSAPTEAPFLCAREGKKGIMTNCVDTARLFGRSRCCKSVVSQRLVQSSLANLCVCPMWCVCGTFQFRKTRCTIVILSMMKRRQPFRQKRANRCVTGDKNFLRK